MQQVEDPFSSQASRTVDTATVNITLPVFISEPMFFDILAQFAADMIKDEVKKAAFMAYETGSSEWEMRRWVINSAVQMVLYAYTTLLQEHFVSIVQYYVDRMPDEQLLRQLFRYTIEHMEGHVLLCAEESEFF